MCAQDAQVVQGSLGPGGQRYSSQTQERDDCILTSARGGSAGCLVEKDDNVKNDLMKTREVRIAWARDGEQSGLAPDTDWVQLCARTAVC